MSDQSDLYLPGEEKFGYISSHFYSLFARVSPMNKFYNFVTESIISRNPEIALDIGFGTGEILKRLCAETNNSRFYGVEPSLHMRNVAARKLASCIKNGRSVITTGSSRSIPFSEKFDLIFSSLSFHHWKEQEKSLSNVLEYLKPDGSFIVFEFGTELLKGYKKITSSHALSLGDLEKFQKIAHYTVKDSGEFRYVEFRKI